MTLLDDVVAISEQVGSLVEREKILTLLADRSLHEVSWSTTHGNDFIDNGCTKTCRMCRAMKKILEITND